MTALRKDSPLAGDVHVSTTGGRKKPKPVIGSNAKLPVTGATLAAQQENPDDDPKMSKSARSLRPNPEDEGQTALSPFPHDPNALANIRPDQTPRFFGALTDPDKLPTARMKLSDLTAMQNRVDPGKVEAMAGTMNTKPPVVVSMAGRHYIADGHHRATRAWLDGEHEIDVKHKDLEPVSNALKGASFGKLLDQIRKSVDQDADEAVTGALVQVMHDCACAIGAQCRDVEGDAKTTKRDDAPTGGADGWSIPFTVAKADADQGLVFGWASVVEKDGALVIDKQQDAILPADLEKAAYDFVLNSRQHGDMHENVGTGQCVESMVFTKDKQAALGVDLGLVGWWVGFKIHDADTRAAIRRGDLPEFSIGGSGRREEIK